MSERSKSPPVGIDLGTTFSSVACLDDSGRPRTIQNAEESLTTPSAVFLDRSGPVVGDNAIKAGILEPARLALFAKRDVGEVAFRNKVLGHSLPPEVLEALILMKLKEDSELVIGPFEKAVVAVPAFFNEPCRKATQDAGRLAGLDVDIINEPTAAAITYGVGQGFLSPQGESRKLERVLVYDLGGGTFDVTVLQIDGRNFHSIATAGNVHLGGIDFDRRIVDFIAEAFLKEHGIDPRDDAFGGLELLQKSNQVKHALSQQESVIIEFNFEGNRIRKELSPAVYETMTIDLVEQTLLKTRNVLDEAKLDFKQLTRLLLVGGSTRMPMIQSELEKLSGLKVDRSLLPDEAICHGAAIYAGIRLNHDTSSFAGVSVTNVNAHDLGVLSVDPKTGQPRRKLLISGNTQLPASKSVRFRTHRKNQSKLKIQIVEGGDDSGVNATMVGTCYVSPLPPDTPKGTAVVVRFDYAQDGRLTVSASLPQLKFQTTTLLDRGRGLSVDRFDQWAQRIADGFDDLEYVDSIPQAPGQTTELEPTDSAAINNSVPAIEKPTNSTTLAAAKPQRKKLKRVKRKIQKASAGLQKNVTSIEIDSDGNRSPSTDTMPSIETSDWKSRRMRVSS